MKRVACYVRVSTDEQKKNGLSVDNQIEALTKYCKDNNYEIVDFYNDAGCSARKTYKSRPQLLRMIRDCQDGKIDLILFTKLDRWFRSVGDYYATMEQLNGVPWRAIWEDYEIETSSGVLKTNIMLSVNQSEADRTRERTKATMEYKRAKGDYIGASPIGYKRHNMRLIKDTDTSDLVAGIFDTYFKTHSIQRCVDYSIDQGHKLSYSGVRRLLSNPTYTGDAKGTECEPYITKDQFDYIKQYRTTSVRRTDMDWTFLYSGMLFCSECGYRLRSSQNKKKGIVYKSYICVKANKNRNHDCPNTITEKRIEEYLLAELDNLIADYNLTVINTAKDDNTDLLKRKAQIEQRVERLGVRYELGDYTTDEYKAKRETLLNEITALEKEVRPKKTVAQLPPTWKDVYASLDEEHKRQYWYSIIEKIIVHPDKTIDVHFMS